MTPTLALLLTLLLFTLSITAGLASVHRALRRLQRDLRDLDSTIRFLAARWQIPLPPRTETVHNGEAGQLLHWENYPIKHEAPDPREVEKMETAC